MVNYIRTTAPGNPAKGETWLDTDDDLVKVYTGTKWVDISQTYQKIKRDTTGTPLFTAVASGLTTGETGTTTTTPTGQAQYVKAKYTLGATLDTPSVALRINAANTKTDSVAATNTTLTGTTTWTTSVTTPNLTADATVTAGTGTLTVTWSFEDRIVVVSR